MDPFASSSEAAARYPTPPFSPPSNQAPAPGLLPPSPAAASARSSMSSTKPQQGHASHRVSLNPPTPAPDDFGAYMPTESVPGSAYRARPVQTLSMPLPLPPAGPVASTSITHASSHTHAAQQNPRQRQSHNPTATLNTASPPKAENLTEEYVLHPSVWAYKTAHPNRPMVGFGPYVLLQTLGEGEFGKVKLGVHNEYGVEVAIKLIRRGSLDDEVRASKVEREIDVLKVSRRSRSRSRCKYSILPRL